MAYVARQMRLKGEGKYDTTEWLPSSMRVKKPTPRPGSVLKRLVAAGAMKAVDE